MKLKKRALPRQGPGCVGGCWFWSLCLRTPLRWRARAGARVCVCVWLSLTPSLPASVGSLAQEEAAIAELQETKRDQEARQRALAYKRDLVQQMSSRTAATNSASEAELLLNKKKFDAARAHLTRRS